MCQASENRGFSFGNKTMAKEINFFAAVWDKLTDATYSVVDAKTNEPQLEFDSILECNFHGSATSTQVPIETGFKKTDYKYANPDDLHLKGIVSKNGTFGIGFLDINYSLTGQNKNTLIEKIRAKCEELTHNLILVNAQTRNSGLRKNYTMTDYVINETPYNFNLLEVDMSFEQVLLFNEDGEMLRNKADGDTQQIGIVESLKQNIGKWWESL